MSLDGVLFLAAFTNRSRAYAQAMAEAGLAPGRVLLFGDKSRDKEQKMDAGSQPGTLEDVFCPDLAQPLEQTCTRAGWNIEHFTADNVNDPGISRRLAAHKPALVIYSGYAGQLVGEDALDLGFDFLHLHSGWLPEFRGSTTIYYSCLKEDRCGVSAILLDKAIDTGPIVARRHYPLPPPGVDVDTLYDNALRADLLVRVLKDFAADHSFQTIENDGGGMPYYVIHPVLKHLAMLSRETGLA